MVNIINQIGKNAFKLILCLNLNVFLGPAATEATPVFFETAGTECGSFTILADGNINVDKTGVACTAAVMGHFACIIPNVTS